MAAPMPSSPIILKPVVTGFHENREIDREIKIIRAFMRWKMSVFIVITVC
jgi:hypothetical protein